MRTYLSSAVLTICVLLAGCQEAAVRTEGDYLNLRNPASITQASALAAPGSGGRGGSAMMPAGLPAPAAVMPASPSGPSVIAASDAPAIQRSIIYNAGLSMVVPDIQGAELAIQSIAGAAGGYLQELDGSTISIRVPGGKFEMVLGEIEKLGEVTVRHVKANDVTEELHDIRIRIDNAEQVRRRLADLVSKSEKMEDTIQLERELERVTESLELLKGKLQYMQDQVAYSTLRVDLNSPHPQQNPVVNDDLAGIPFAWVKELGDGAAAGISANVADVDRGWNHSERFTLPAGFIRYFDRDGVTEAMSAEGVIIKVRREDNYDGGDVGFWSKLARRAIVENRAIAVLSESDTKVKAGDAGHIINGVKDAGGKKQGYFLGIVATKRYVYTFEAWGEKGSVEQERGGLEGAFGTLEVKR